MKGENSVKLHISIILLSMASAVADPIKPYGVSAPGSFAVATAGSWGGNSVGHDTVNNLVFGSANTQQFVGSGAQAASVTYAASPTSTSAAQALANLGILNLSSSSIFSDEGLGLIASALADAGWLDTYTISDPTLTGQSGVLTFLLHADGLLTSDGWNGSQFSLSVQSQPFVNDFFVRETCDSRNAPACSLSINSTYAVSIPFVFGNSFEMSVRAIALSRAPSVKSPQPIGQGAAQFQNTVYWAGISSVTSGGNPVSGYTISSLSGTNYNQSFAPTSAVPEPSSYALVALAGVCALYHRRRR